MRFLRLGTWLINLDHVTSISINRITGDYSIVMTDSDMMSLPLTAEQQAEMKAKYLFNDLTGDFVLNPNFRLKESSPEHLNS